MAELMRRAQRLGSPAGQHRSADWARAASLAEPPNAAGCAGTCVPLLACFVRLRYRMCLSSAGSKQVKPHDGEERHACLSDMAAFPEGRLAALRLPRSVRHAPAGKASTSESGGDLATTQYQRSERKTFICSENLAHVAEPSRMHIPSENVKGCITGSIAMFRESSRQCQPVLRRGLQLFARESGASGVAWSGQTQQDANILRLAAQQRRWQHGYRDNRCTISVA